MNFGVRTSYYDKKARMRKMKPGEKVLVLLLSPSNLLMQWQGPYQTCRKSMLNVLNQLFILLCQLLIQNKLINLMLGVTRKQVFFKYSLESRIEMRMKIQLLADRRNKLWTIFYADMVMFCQMYKIIRMYFYMKYR